MLSDFHLGIDLIDRTIGIDQVGDPINAFIFTSVEFLGTPCAVGFEHVVVFVAEQGILESVLLHELFLFLWGIGTDTDDLDTTVGKCLEFITESLALSGSARGAGFGKKPENQTAPGEITEGYVISIGIRESKWRGFLAWF